MATFALIHGGGGNAWHWRLLEAQLRSRGHETVAVDLPVEDPDAGLLDYADTVVRALGPRDDVVVVAHSWGGFIGPLVCDRLPAARLLVLVAAMVPVPGEPPADWWTNSGFGMKDIDDEIALFLQDVPPDLAAEVVSTGREHKEKALLEPWPLAAWPDVPTRFLLCRDDRWFEAAFLRRMARERLGVVPDEMDGGHSPMLSRPKDLADRLESYL